MKSLGGPVVIGGSKFKTQTNHDFHPHKVDENFPRDGATNMC